MRATHHYTAYGLGITSGFDLPGCQALDEPIATLPRIALMRCESGELQQAWSGASGDPQWRGRLGDGLELTIERGTSEDLLFVYGERARFRLNREMDELLCAPAQAKLDWQRVLISKVLPAISVMRGYEGLHAAAVDAPDGVVAIMAPSGSGKSTLACELLGRGWPLFADDVLILQDDDGVVQAHAGTPHMNLATDAPEALDAHVQGTTLAVLAGERWIAASAVTAGQRRPVRMLCMLERRAGLALRSERLPSSPLLLAPYILGLETDPQRQRSRFGLYADLIQSTPLVRIAAGLEHRPRELAACVENALGETANLAACESA